MTWFEELTGFRESFAEVRQRLAVDGETMTSLANGRTFRHGRLETPSLAELRGRTDALRLPSGNIRLRELVGDVKELHADENNAGALFQVASQFNLLEMVHPDRTPEDGVGKYEQDPTQGPTCAIAAGAGTIYRNYFAEVGGQIGQANDRQIDCLSDLGEELGNVDGSLWMMRNGYALPSLDGLERVCRRISQSSEKERDRLRSLLKIGIQWDTQVTLGTSRHLVSQAFCSAMPVAYSALAAELWEPFACLVLEAAYEATICAAIVNAGDEGTNRVFLTLVGGGAFGNRREWIVDALGRALRLHAGRGLDVVIVSHGNHRPELRGLLREINGTYQ